MLSSKSNQLSSAHRRQNSTPTTSNTPEKAVHAPAPTNPNHSAHRRGLSVDFAMLSQKLESPYKQDNGNMITNNGLYEQQIMRAAQTPAMARPGPDQYYNFEDVNAIPTGLEAYVNFRKKLEPLGTQPDPFGWLVEDDSQPIDQDQDHVSQHIQRGKVGAGACDSAMADLKRQQPTLPETPRRERRQDRFPMTPSTGASNRRPLSLDLSLELIDGIDTIKASSNTPMRRGNSCQESYAMTKQNPIDLRMPSPSNTAPLRDSHQFDLGVPEGIFMDISDLNGDLYAYGNGYNSSSYSPITNRASPAMSSFQSSPDLPPVSLFGSDAQLFPNLSALPPQIDVSDLNDVARSHSKGSPKKAPSSKAQSDDESSFNPLDWMINDTGITEEEINAHIQGPDVNSKYTCLYEGCKNGPFGRKENIRAHVQTHLDDRRFKCDVCNNRFVRPNDLKRHYNIHVNKRDFKCICNAAFNRHDALKRHRERNIWCESGGTQGSPDSPKKEEKKRGRPRKIAPTETQERRERKALIRRQVLKKKAASTASSVASSHPSPPPDFDIPDLQQNQPFIHNQSPTNGSLTPPASPGNSIDDIFSPSYSHQSYVSKDDSLSPPPTRGSMTHPFMAGPSKEYGSFSEDPFGESEPSLPTIASVSKSNSQYGTPPELELGSSSPSTRFADFTTYGEVSRINRASRETRLFDDDVMMKTNSDDFDKMFPLFGDAADTLSPSKHNEMDLFRNPEQDEMDDLFWTVS